MSQQFHAATRKGLFRWERDQSGSWAIAEVSFLGDPVTNVLADSGDGAVYAALNHSHFGQKLHRSDDGGKTWQEITTPAFPPKPDDVEDLDPVRKTPIPWTVKDVWALSPGGSDPPEQDAVSRPGSDIFA